MSKQNYFNMDDEADTISPLHCQMGALEVLAHCVNMGWMAIIVKSFFYFQE